MTWTSSFQKCAEIVVAHLGYLNYTQYRVTVGFEHLNQPIKEMNFTVSTRPAASFCGSLVRWFDASGFILENQFKSVEPKNSLNKQHRNGRSQGALSPPSPRLAACDFKAADRTHTFHLSILGDTSHTQILHKSVSLHVEIGVF